MNTIKWALGHLAAMNEKLREWARTAKRELVALYAVSRDARVPWYARALAILVVGYALSPVDLIPDFIPVLGYLDDIVLVPIGIYLVIKLVPKDVLAEHRDRAASVRDRPVSKLAGIIIVLIWISVLLLGLWIAHQYFFE